MSQEPQTPREYNSTYVVQDRSNEEELNRLRIQDQMLTEGMGGVWPEQKDITGFQRILDVGCGTGGWLIETASTYPDLSLLVGVDISKRMLAYAREQAKTQGVGDRIEFHVMDALRMLEFPDNSFDLVNQRLNFSYLRTWDWPKLLLEYQRVCKPGGVIRITEGDIFPESTGPTLNRLSDLGRLAFLNAGHLFSPGRRGVTSMLPNLLDQQVFSNVHTHTIVIDYRPGSARFPAFYDNLALAFRTMLPFLRKWTQVPDDYETIYQQALQEMQHLDFRATGEMVTVWGTKA